MKKKNTPRNVDSPKVAIVMSASSDIGFALCQRWVKAGWQVFGTYRTQSRQVEELKKMGVKLVYCDIADITSIQDATHILRTICSRWDVLVMCPGTQNPIGPFMKVNINDWDESVRVNFTGVMRFIHDMLPTRRLNSNPEPCVLLYAGGGTNDAPPNYSAYIISKIALIKMCELLDTEVPDTRFVILGPGWVKTKIHNATVKAGAARAGANYQKTLEHISNNEFVPMHTVLNCCDWIIRSSRKEVSGRNFSVVFDKWDSKELSQLLLKEHQLYKLRRYGNDRLVKR